VITDQAATEQTRYLAAPVCTPRSADRPRSTPSAAKLIITRLLCTRWRAPRRNNSCQPQSAESRAAGTTPIESSALGLLCSLNQKSELFFFCVFVNVRLAQTPCSTHCLQAKLQQPQQQTNLRIRKHYF